MFRLLPAQPNLDQLKHQAKDLVKAHARRDPDVLPALARLRRFEGASRDAVFDAKLQLHEAQFALALDYGFPSWDALARQVRSTKESVIFRDDRAAKVTIRGDRPRQDGFSLAMTAAMGVLGRPVDYRSVYLWSANAFAPDIRPEEPTRCHWQLQGRERCLDVIAAAAGVSVRPFPDYHELADIPPRPKGKEQVEAWVRDYYAKPAARYLSDALEAGEVVVSCGEWVNSPDLLWCEWGLVVEARTDGTILGAAPNGRRDNLITHIRDGWVLRADGSPLPAGEIRKRVLQRGIQRIRGEGPVFGPGSRKVVFGLAAMDAWISAMSDVPFDIEQWQHDDHSVRAATETAIPTLAGSKAAAAYLREMAGDVSASAAAALRDAAGYYDHIVELFSPAMAGEGPDSYQAIMGDLAKQQAHAETVLRPIKTELERATGAMGRALDSVP